MRYEVRCHGVPLCSGPLFVRDSTIKGARSALDALQGADGIVGVVVRTVGFRTPDEKHKI